MSSVIVLLRLLCLARRAGPSPLSTVHACLAVDQASTREHPGRYRCTFPTLQLLV